MIKPDRFPPLRIEAWRTDARLKRLLPAARSGLFNILLYTWSECWPDCILPDDPEVILKASGLGKDDWLLYGMSILEVLTRESDGRWSFDLLNDEREKLAMARARMSTGGRHKYTTKEYVKGRRSAKRYKSEEPTIRVKAVVRKERPSPVEKIEKPVTTVMPEPQTKTKAKRMNTKEITAKWFDQHPEQAEKFNQFYEKYPRHTDREEARNQWRKLNPGDDLFQVIMDTLQAQLDGKHFPQYDDGEIQKEFVMQSSRWLHGQHWNDEVVANIRRRSNGQPQGFTKNTGRKHGHADESGRYDGRKKFTEQAAIFDGKNKPVGQ